MAGSQCSLLSMMSALIATLFVASDAARQAGFPAAHTLRPVQAGQHNLVLDGPAADGFSLDETLALAALSSVVYCADEAAIRDWSCSRCIKLPQVAKFEPQVVLTNVMLDLLVLIGYHPALDAVVAVFRGTHTKDVLNWVKEIEVQPTDYPAAGPGAQVHSGFLLLWKTCDLKAGITEAIEKLLVRHAGARLIVTGHSLGGALATLVGLEVKADLALDSVSVTTFGSPRVGNQAFASYFNSAIKHSWRVTHGSDIVPSVPIQFMHYHHVATEAWQRGAKPQVVLCDDSGEDPSCLLSQCSFTGICFSVDDHMQYLGFSTHFDPAEC